MPKIQSILIISIVVLVVVINYTADGSPFASPYASIGRGKTKRLGNFCFSLFFCLKIISQKIKMFVLYENQV